MSSDKAPRPRGCFKVELGAGPSFRLLEGNLAPFPTCLPLPLSLDAGGTSAQLPLLQRRPLATAPSASLSPLASAIPDSFAFFFLLVQTLQTWAWGGGVKQETKNTTEPSRGRRAVYSQVATAHLFVKIVLLLVHTYVHFSVYTKKKSQTRLFLTETPPPKTNRTNQPHKLS